MLFSRVTAEELNYVCTVMSGTESDTGGRSPNNYSKSCYCPKNELRNELKITGGNKKKFYKNKIKTKLGLLGSISSLLTARSSA